MGAVFDWQGHPDFHPATFIQEEMGARNWTRDRMAVAMAQHSEDEPGICRLKLDLYLDVGPTDTRLRLGRTATEIARAFGVSDEFFLHLETSWLAAALPTADATTALDHIRAQAKAEGRKEGMREAITVAEACRRHNAGKPDDYHKGLSSAGQAIASAIHAHIAAAEKEAGK